MKRSRLVRVTIVATLGITLGPLVASCGGKENPPSQALHCVDANNVVVEERLCDDDGSGTGSPGGYAWWYGGTGGRYYGTGTQLTSGSRTAVDGATYKTAGGVERAGFGGSSRSISSSGGGKVSGAGG
jgi:hypothetical protein